MTAVAVASYGDKYLPMLLSFLESWGAVFPKIYLALGDTSEGVTEELAGLYPRLRIIQPPISFSRREEIRISQKMRLWLALADHPEVRDHAFTVFADADTILIKEIAEFCHGDVVLTLRTPPSQFILNTGVVGLSSKALAAGFVHEWAKRNEAILGDPAALAVATSREYPYGGGDQMALVQMLGLVRSSTALHFGDLQVRTVPCAEFNACEKRIDPSKARVIHQKASLHKFLLERRPLMGSRKLQDSLFQLRAAIEANETATARMISTGIAPERVDKLYRFRLPRGIRGDLSIPSPIMALHRSKAAGRRLAGAVLRRAGLR